MEGCKRSGEIRGDLRELKWLLGSLKSLLSHIVEKRAVYFKKMAIFLVFSYILTSCAYIHVPPGQVKKQDAPGQMKKEQMKNRGR